MKIRDLAVAGVLLALILVFLLVPVYIGPLSLAVVAILAVIVACEFEGLKMGLFTGLAFGVTSLIASFTTGAGSPTSPIFHNPLVSVLPRVIVPITCYFAYRGMRKAFKIAYSKKVAFNAKAANRLSLSVSAVVGAIVGVVTNTTLVMCMMFAFNAGKTFGNTTIGTGLLVLTLSTNFPLELGVCAAVAAPLLLALAATFKTGNRDGLAPILKPVETLESDIPVEETVDNDILTQTADDESDLPTPSSVTTVEEVQREIDEE